jgi:hypothetical protein
MVHELKTWPEYFQEVKAGKKTFEVRKNDRKFQVGDTLVLKEWKPKVYSSVSPNELEGAYTGDEVRVTVTYLLISKPEHISFIGVSSDVAIMAIQKEKSGKEVAERLFELHTHAEIVNDQEPGQIVYREKDVISLLKYLGLPEPVWTS